MHELVRQLEALLFVAGRPLSLAELSEATQVPGEDVSAALELLAGEFAGHSLRLVQVGERVELATIPETATTVERFLATEAATPLSKPALETLAIVAQHQPITKAEIDDSRGVASDQTLRNLLGRGLIEQVGRSAEVGRPPQYGVTTLLLRQLGVASLAELQLDAETHED